MTRPELMKQIESLVQQLVTRYAPEKVILFGSVASNETEVNDVDLFIVKNEVPRIGADRIRQLYRMMDTDLPVDYLVYRPSEVQERLILGDPFVTGIFREGMVLYG